MQIKDAMTRDVRTIAPDISLREAARTMGEIDAGLLPVAEADRLVGVLTDRDIAVRAIAAGLGPDARVREAMSDQVRYCFDDQDSDEVCRNMGEQQVRRLPVVDRNKRLVGIVSLADLARNGAADECGAALGQITRPGGQHTQYLQQTG